MAQVESSARIKRVVELREGEDRFCGVKEAAGLLHVSDATIRRYLTEKRLKRFKVKSASGQQAQGMRTLLDRAEVLSLIVEG
jgi:DeoR/GlpR family transcriptional regulator of sugar metabolism